MSHILEDSRCKALLKYVSAWEAQINLAAKCEVVLATIKNKMIHGKIPNLPELTATSLFLSGRDATVYENVGKIKRNEFIIDVLKNEIVPVIKDIIGPIISIGSRAECNKSLSSIQLPVWEQLKGNDTLEYVNKMAKLPTKLRVPFIDVNATSDAYLKQRGVDATLRALKKDFNNIHLTLMDDSYGTGSTFAIFGTALKKIGFDTSKIHPIAVIREDKTRRK